MRGVLPCSTWAFPLAARSLSPSSRLDTSECSTKLFEFSWREERPVRENPVEGMPVDDLVAKVVMNHVSALFLRDVAEVKPLVDAPGSNEGGSSFSGWLLAMITISAGVSTTPSSTSKIPASDSLS